MLISDEATLLVASCFFSFFLSGRCWSWSRRMFGVRGNGGCALVSLFSSLRTNLTMAFFNANPMGNLYGMVQKKSTRKNKQKERGVETFSLSLSFISLSLSLSFLSLSHFFDWISSIFLVVELFEKRVLHISKTIDWHTQISSVVEREEFGKKKRKHFRREYIFLFRTWLSPRLFNPVFVSFVPFSSLRTQNIEVHLKARDDAPVDLVSFDWCCEFVEIFHVFCLSNSVDVVPDWSTYTNSKDGLVSASLKQMFLIIDHLHDLSVDCRLEMLIESNFSNLFSDRSKIEQFASIMMEMSFNDTSCCGDQFSNHWGLLLKKKW